MSGHDRHAGSGAHARSAAAAALRSTGRAGVRTTGGARESAHGVEVAEALDALVAAVQGDPEGLEAAAAALLERWREREETTLRFDGLTIRCGETVALQAEGEGGRWILPATMAGLRALGPKDATRAEDAVELAGLLDGLGCDADAVHALRDLLWCGGLGGWRVEVGPAWADRLDLLPRSAGAREALEEARGEAVRARALAFAAANARRDPELDAANARVADYARRARAGELSLAPAMVATLRNACDNGVFWVHQAGELLRARPELEAGLSPGRLGHALTSFFEAGGDLRAAQSVAALGGEPDGLIARTREALPVQSLGRATGRSMPLDKRTLAQLAAFFDQHATAFSRGVARGLLERAAGDEASADRLARFVHALGVARMWPHVRLTAAPDAVTRGVARLLKMVDAGPNCWSDLVAWSSPGVAAWILRHAPPIVLSRVEANLKSLLRERSPQENAPLIQALAEQGSTSALRSLGEALLETRGKGWAGKVVPVICHALLKKRMGAQYLLPLFRDRSAEPAMRLLVLRTLEADPELLAEATRFHMGEIVEPPEIKERLKAARKRLRRTGR